MWSEESVMGNNSSSTGSTRSKPVEARKNSTSEEVKQSVISSQQSCEMSVIKCEQNLRTGPVMGNFCSSKSVTHEHTQPTKQSYVQQLFDTRRKGKSNDSKKKTVPISRYLPLFTVHFASIALRNNNRVKNFKTISPWNEKEEVKGEDLLLGNMENEKKKRKSEEPTARRIFIKNKAKSTDCVRIDKEYNLKHVKFVSPKNTNISKEKLETSNNDYRRNSLRSDFISHLGKYSPQTSRERVTLVENKTSSKDRGTHYYNSTDCENKTNSSNITVGTQSKLKSDERFMGLKSYRQMVNRSYNTSVVQSRFGEFTKYRQNSDGGNLDMNMCMFNTLEPNYSISIYTDISKECSPRLFNKTNINSKSPKSLNLERTSTSKNKEQFQKDNARVEKKDLMKETKSLEPEMYETSLSKSANVHVMTKLDKISKHCNSSSKSSAHELANSDWIPEQYKIESTKDLSKIQYPRETRQAFILMISDIKTDLKNEKFNALPKEIDDKVKCKEIIEERINTSIVENSYNFNEHDVKTCKHLKDQNIPNSNGHKKEFQQVDKNIVNVKTRKNFENRSLEAKKEENKIKDNVKYNGKVDFNDSGKVERVFTRANHGYGDISGLSSNHERHPNICKRHSSSYIESASSLSTDASYYRVQKLFQSMISENKNGKLRRFRRNISGYKEMDRLGLGTWDKKRWTPSDSKAYTILNEFQKNVTGFQGDIKCKRK